MHGPHISRVSDLHLKLSQLLGFHARVDNRRGNRSELIDFQNASDLREQPMKQAEIPTGDADDGGQTFVIERFYRQMNAFGAPGRM